MGNGILSGKSGRSLGATVEASASVSPSNIPSGSSSSLPVFVAKLKAAMCNGLDAAGCQGVLNMYDFSCKPVERALLAGSIWKMPALMSELSTCAMNARKAYEDIQIKNAAVVSQATKAAQEAQSRIMVARAQKAADDALAAIKAKQAADAKKAATPSPSTPAAATSPNWIVIGAAALVAVVGLYSVTVGKK